MGERYSSPGSLSRGRKSVYEELVGHLEQDCVEVCVKQSRSPRINRQRHGPFKAGGSIRQNNGIMMEQRRPGMPLSGYLIHFQSWYVCTIVIRAL